MNEDLTLRFTGIFAGAFGPALLVGGLLVLYPVRVQATPQFTQQTGKPCTECHTRSPPKLNDTGKKFKADGNKF
jgi:hypothetical protein